METSKQKAIREAYGEYWEYFKDKGYDENGYTMFFVDDLKHEIWSKITLDKHIYDNHVYRPKSLQGIETNNGWIKIESELDLPNNYQELYFIIKGSEQKMKAGYYYDEAFITLNDSHYKNIVSHYQPIIKPQPPIY